jgi:DNA ligase-1
VKHPTLYKRTSNGKVERWAIWTEGADIVSEYGHVGGAQQTARETAVGKNIGRANETTPIEQAKLQAESEWTVKKSRKGYVEDLQKAEAGENSGAGGIRPMLAQTFSKHGDKITFPCYAQPKLDGLRCIAVVGDDGSVSLWSREQKPIIAIPRIAAAIESLNLPPGTVLDGECYNHALKSDFEKIVSAVRKQYPASEEEQALIEYHVYDVPRHGGTFKERHLWLQSTLRTLADGQAVLRHPALVYVMTYKIDSQESLDAVFNDCRAEGYEGAMARNDVPYEEGKRSYGLQKLKEFDEAEFPIVGVEEGVGKMAGLAVFVCMTGKLNIGGDQTFRCKMEGELEGLRKYLTNKKLWEGKQLTVKYQGLTGKNKLPRFPVGKAVRDYE